MAEKLCRSCADCAIVNCSKHDRRYPEFCLTTQLEQQELDDVVDLYTNDPLVKKITQASAQVEGRFYGQYTRVEEVMEFSQRIGARKVGIATCAGLINESRTFTKILRFNDFEVYGVACKVGVIDKKAIGIDQEFIMKEGESICNPILQAKLLEKAGTELNVVVGLCIGHDSLFYKYSHTTTTTLVTKDRVLGHNPAACLHLTGSYYKKLLTKKTV